MDPLSYFGILQNATRSELDEAYRYLREKNECDKNDDSIKRDISENKLREIDDMYRKAVEFIDGREMTQPQQPAAVTVQPNENFGGGNNGNTYNNENNGQNDFIGFENECRSINTFINDKNFTAAEQLLNKYNLENYAKWHYTFARLRFAQGWMNEALEHYKKAYELEPNNAIYRQSYQHICDMRDGKIKKRSNAAAVGIAVGFGAFYICCQASPIFMDTPCCKENCEECADKTGVADYCFEPCCNASGSYCDTLCNNCCGGCER